MPKWIKTNKLGVAAAAVASAGIFSKNTKNTNAAVSEIFKVIIEHARTGYKSANSEDINSCD